jgi:hypothetical protein
VKKQQEGYKEVALTMQEVCQDKKSLKESNKFRLLCSKLRTDVHLAKRSKLVDGQTLKKLNEEIAHILVSKHLIYPSTLYNIGLDEDMSLEDKKDFLEIPKVVYHRDKKTKRFDKFMRNSAQDQNQSNWRFRIAQEAIDKHKEGWYPFFITLTVDPKVVDSEELWKKGRAWQAYLRKLSTVVTDLKGEPPFWKTNAGYKYRPMSDYMTYAAVLEHGKSREHHHVHAIVWFRDIPNEWKQCPNRRCSKEHSVHNNCRPLESNYWEYGKCDARYFRTIGDIWEKKHKFVIPLKTDVKTGKAEPMKVAPVDYAGAYLTKYLQKDHKEWQHRMKATRNLGIVKLKQRIMKMEPEEVEALTWRPETLKLNLSLKAIHTLPLGLLRSVAKQIDFWNKYKANALDLKTLTERPENAYIKMLRSVQLGVRPDRMPLQEYYEWLDQHLPEQKGYCEKRLIEAHEKLGKDWPKLFRRVKSVKLGANKR